MRRLGISIALGTLAVALLAVQALAAPPDPISPANDAFLPNGQPIVFTAAGNATAGPPSHLDIHVSKTGTPDASGFLPFFYNISPASPNGSGSYSASSDPEVLTKPGDYYWQAVNPECGAITSDCYGAVRHFTILPLPASAVTDPSQVETFLNKKPRHRTHHRKVKFSFSSNVQGAKFQCLFATGWEKCKSPHIFRHLKAGRYKFEVRAVINGIQDPDPEIWFFRILHHH